MTPSIRIGSRRPDKARKMWAQDLWIDGKRETFYFYNRPDLSFQVWNRTRASLPADYRM